MNDVDRTRKPGMAIVAVLMLLAMLLVGSPATLAAEAAAELASVLEPGPQAWEISADKTGKPDALVANVDGLTALQPRARALSLTYKEKLELPAEVALRLRLQGQSSLRLTLGTPAPDSKRMPLDVSLAKDTDAVGYTITAPGLKDPLRGTFTGDGIGDRKLSWPDDFRRIIEGLQAQLTPLEEQWLDLRLQLGKERMRVYLQDRLLADLPLDAAPLAQNLVVYSSSGASLAKAALRPLPAADPRWELLPAGSYANARAIGAAKLADDALPAGSKAVTVDGIPFQVIQPTAAGNDHIDVGVSWLPGGRLLGHMGTRGTGITARWAGSMAQDPMRVQFRIPAGRYQAVHLLAVASGVKDTLPLVTAQFYRPQRGFPQSFHNPQPVPGLFAATPSGLQVTTADGKKGQLFHVTIPVEVGKLAAFDGADDLELELTKAVEIFRGYPDPSYYSIHGAGLPSGVQVFAVTLERPAVEMTLTPGAFADSWMAPEKPRYQVQLHNRDSAPRKVQLNLRTTSYLSKQTFEQSQSVTVPAGGSQTVELTWTPPCHGYHDLLLEMQDGQQVWREERGLAYLHQDTRQRGDWEHGRGPIFGFWNWRGAHNTPSGAEQVALMGLAGAESSSGSFEETARVTEEERAAARRFKMKTFKAFGAGDHYVTARFAGALAKEGLAPAKEKFLADMEKSATKASDINRPELMSFFPEPHLGQSTFGTPPEYYGGQLEPPTQAEQDKFNYFLQGFIEGSKILKEHYPNVKPMLPHGDPLFCLPFLNASSEARQYFQGIAVDIPVFERLPEQQIHQVSLHRMYFCRDGLNKLGITDPTLAMYEGPSRSAYYGALSDQELADFSVRDSLLLLAYGVDRQLGGWAPFESASFWGEQHYGGGICHRLPRGTPRPAYAAFATMTRHLNRRNFVKALNTGSLSLYAMEFVHYKTGEKMHVFWTIRGQRPVTLALPAGAKVTAWDLMDNQVTVPVKDGQATLTVTSSPQWVYGLSGTEALTLGAPDHRDAAPAAGALQLASLGDGSWKQNGERDEDYEHSHDQFVRRFPGKMTVAPTPAALVPAPAPGDVAKDGKSLAVRLEKQDQEQKFMPFYTAVAPPQPLVIPGKASHLGLWVRGASDWGRVVYALRDAKGERWLSVGTKGSWNCDDIYNWSVFAFDGWRYLRFELPASSPWDSYREPGSVWWGSYGPGDDIVDLPLRLEKILVERRTHAMYVIDPQPCNGQDVFLGNLYAEYEHAQDQSDEAIRLSQLRMPVPAGSPELDNPIAQLSAEGVGQPVPVTKITLPDQEADGTRCYVHFEEAAGAASYEIWASPYLDGRGALQLAKDWKAAGGLIRGLRPDTAFYLFVIARDKDGKPSKPAPGFEITLKDMFGMK